jgi:hypothetical protein
MSTQPPKMPENPSIEERLERLEAAETQRAVENRLQRLESNADVSDEADHEDEAETPRIEGKGEEALHLALADLIKSGTATQIARDCIDLFKQSSEHKVKETEAQRRFGWKTNVLGTSFGLLIFGAVCALRWHDKITQELAAGLIGSLIGYWYGRERGR